MPMPLPMKLMIAFELASTGAEEMSLFQRLSAGKDRKPPRLAPCPRESVLQLEACVEPVTCKLTLEEALLPGSGLLTLIEYVPAELTTPVAVSWLAETNVVWSGVVPRRTCEPFTNLLPVAASVKFPVPTLDGLIPAITGVGFKILTLLDPPAAGSAELVARTVIVLGLGRATGDV